MAVLSRLFLIATLALATSAQFTETYPEDGSIPTPKKEWMDIIAKAKISDAPVRKSNGDDGKITNIIQCFITITITDKSSLLIGPQPSGGNDPYCWYVQLHD